MGRVDVMRDAAGTWQLLGQYDPGYDLAQSGSSRCKGRGAEPARDADRNLWQ